jgi:hypothetical protein
VSRRPTVAGTNPKDLHAPPLNRATSCGRSASLSSIKYRMFIADPPLSRATMNHTNGDSLPVFTPRQSQYPAFIHAYTLMNGCPPAQADIQRFFQATPPSVHQMLLTLERSGLNSWRAGVSRSIAVLVDRSALPALERGHGQSVKITVTRCQRDIPQGDQRISLRVGSGSLRHLPLRRQRRQSPSILNTIRFVLSPQSARIALADPG